MEPRIPLRNLEDPNAFVLQPFLDSVSSSNSNRPLNNPAILPMDQMKASRAENHYVDSPIALQPGRRRSLEQPGELGLPAWTARTWTTRTARPGSIVSSASGSSDQRLLDHPSPSPVGEQGCPRAWQRPQLSKGHPPPSPPKGTPHSPGDGRRALLCECCGKCKCAQCASPRTLPSCLVCGQVCLCSPQSLVNYATCMCLVKGFFYHCVSGEEEEEERGDGDGGEGRGCCLGADKPCCCTPRARAGCCARWCCMGAVSLLLPCLLCYPPATGCVKLSQKLYDAVSRPGCRCKHSNSVYRKVPESPGCNGGEKPP
ncbi:protein sprouty homolog 4 [Callorhinchus milii]|uniref:protein sprouty homolog 4 n=1 Tax=Callorhinchus milii TaxID=7868 RepID=UPI001C3FE897|nr:protein sprouty homolog 4 [Callorhinchus milii]